MNPYPITSVGQGWNKALGIRECRQTWYFPADQFWRRHRVPRSPGPPQHRLWAKTRYSIQREPDRDPWTPQHQVRVLPLALRDNPRTNPYSAGTSPSIIKSPASRLPEPVELGQFLREFPAGRIEQRQHPLDQHLGLTVPLLCPVRAGRLARDFQVHPVLRASLGRRSRPYEIHDQISSFSPTVRILSAFLARWFLVATGLAASGPVL